MLKKQGTICKYCEKEFVYKNMGDIYAGGKEREDIVCPYCNKVNFSKMTSGYFCSYKLEDLVNTDLIDKRTD